MPYFQTNDTDYPRKVSKFQSPGVPAEMNNREWFSLALRLFGIWLFIQAIEEFVPYLLFFISDSGPWPGFTYAAGLVVWFFVRTAVGLVLLLFAPAIAARFYPSTSSDETQPVEEEASVVKVGIQLLGVYALLLAGQSVSGVVMGYLTGNTFIFNQGLSFNDSASYYLSNLLTFGLNLALAAIFIIWNEQVITLLAKFRYVPERDAYEPPPLNG